MSNTTRINLLTYDVMELLRDPNFTMSHLEGGEVYVGEAFPKRGFGTVPRFEEVIKKLETRLITTVTELLEIEQRSRRAKMMPSILSRFIGEVVSKSERETFTNGVFEACNLINQIIESQERRRLVLISYLDEAAQWSVTELTLEIRQREREAQRVLGDIEIPVGERHALATLYREQQDFAKDVINELRPILETVKAMPKKKPLAQDIKEKARAKAEVKAQMSKERDDLKAKYPDQEQEISRMYRKMFDDLEEST